MAHMTYRPLEYRIARRAVQGYVASELVLDTRRLGTRNLESSGSPSHRLVDQV